MSCTPGTSAKSWPTACGAAAPTMPTTQPMRSLRLRGAGWPMCRPARPWLFVVAKRVLYRRRRGAKRFRRLVEKAGGIRHHGGPDPETVVVQRAEYEAVLQAAARLSVRDREVLNLAA